MTGNISPTIVLNRTIASSRFTPKQNIFLLVSISVLHKTEVIFETHNKHRGLNHDTFVLVIRFQISILDMISVQIMKVPGNTDD